MKTVWLHQRRELQRLAVMEGLPSMGRRGHLKDALTFGEMLTLISNEEGTSLLIREDRQGALSFLDVIGDLDDAMESAQQLTSTSEMNGPFHELADFAVEFINKLRQMVPEKFE